ncbi:MAG TPA: valine--tRNA ligase [Saprospiraceae bacterium]|nr:valine--tRNA ligase [Saprospiraceae bacterium]HMQ83401.1 valine--tRNA ligase [Saprospiraceae bacterium]
MTLSTRYNPRETEEKWYQHWMEQGYFHSTPDEREPFCIVIPPPNVTGVLHMGHMLNNTIQDILIRKARLDGKNACWVPGTDHASIATEAKVVKMLRDQGIKKSDLSRDEFLQHAWGWKEKYGGIILEQLKRLGASCDWERTCFTMDAQPSAAVMRVFVDLFQKGRIYRGLRMTNWDPVAKTVLSNEEVIYSDENSQLFHIRYDIEGEPGRSVVIATQRPETIMADTALAVHPQDERYADLIGKKALIPLINKPIPIIADHYVEREFGTGALKVTPAHDQNDYDIGQRHQLEVVDILTEDGRLNEAAQILVGEDRFEARKKIKKLLEEAGHLIQLEAYRTKIGRSERTDAVVEPRLTQQWFVDMRHFARMALNAVSSNQVRFYPEQMWNMYHSWLREENVRDWCISRQLWWGHRIPAWYYGEHFFVAETAEAALEQARAKTGIATLNLSDLKQDEDVLDTWFSSWLWPMTVFNGFESQEELAYYYPTSTLVTGWDIMFFWVARMIMAGYEWSGELLGLNQVLEKGRFPFRDVYFTGMVRDFKRRKMSKSLGNSPDALELIDNYGADGVRFGLLSSAAAGNDIVFDAPIDEATKTVLNESKLCEQGRNFCNKMWNALRLIKGWEQAETAASPAQAAINELATTWMEHRIRQVHQEVEAQFKDYRLSEAIMNLYKLIWDDFCSWYLEMIKPGSEGSVEKATYLRTLDIYEYLMKLLHPFMPFVTEEIWHQLKDRLAGEDCIVTSLPTVQDYDLALIDGVEKAKTVVSAVRETRNSKGVSPKIALKVFAQESAGTHAMLQDEGRCAMVVKMANLEQFELTRDNIDNSIVFQVGPSKFYVQLEQQIDAEAECSRLKKELEYYEGFVNGVQKKLGNEKFVNSAPAQVVELERKKLSDGEQKIKNIQEALASLDCG